MRASSRHAPAHPGRGAKDRGAAGGEGNSGPHAAARVDTLERLAGPVVRAAGMDLEEVQLIPVGRRRVIRVVVDTSGGVGLDDIALVSQALSAELDATGCMGDLPYTLEVTSPGVDRPLTAPRHWQRSVGRMVKVTVTGPGRAGVAGGAGPVSGAAVTAKRTVSGRIMAADDAGVVLDIGGEQRGFGFSELGPGKVQVEFRRDDMGESRGH